MSKDYSHFLTRLFATLLVFFTFYQFSTAQCVITLQPGPQDGKDVKPFNMSCTSGQALQNGNCDTTFTGNNPWIGAHGWTFGGTQGFHRTFIEFDLDSLVQAGCIVTNATLTLFPIGTPQSYHCGTNTTQHPCHSNEMEIQRVTSAWDEQTMNALNPPPVTAGTTAQDYRLFPNEDDPYISHDFEITAMVNYWLSNPGANFGMRLKLVNETPYAGRLWASSDATDSTLRPMLTLTLSCSNSCQSLLSGNIYDDSNSNCTFDSGELPLENWLVRIDPGPTYATTDPNGYWQAQVSSGTYTISPYNPNTYLWDSVCPLNPWSHTTFIGALNTVSALDFPMHADVYCPQLRVDVAGNFLRPCHNENYLIKYCNDGNTMETGVYVDITLAPSFTIQNSQFPWTSSSGNTFTFLIDTLLPGACDQFWISAKLSCNVSIGDIYCVSAEIFPQDSCTAPPSSTWDRSSVSVTGICEGDTLACFTITNTGSASNGNMLGSSPFRIYENGSLVFTGSFQLCGGCDTIICWPATGVSIRLEADQRPGHPGNSHPNHVVDNCGLPTSTSMINSQPQDDQNPHLEIDCQEVRASYDPNDKAVVPKGVFAEHYIEAEDQLEYKIRFQNTGNDTAFIVVIRDTLSPFLDISTIQLGVASHNFHWRIYGNRIMEWTFDNILLPDSNINEPASHGFLKFKVEQMPGNSNGIVIQNSAGIYFDHNAPVLTPTVFNTIGEDVITTLQVRMNEIKMYPNPTLDLVYLEGSALTTSTRVVVQDMSGKIVQKGTNLYPGKMRVNLSGLAKGIYILKLKTDKESKSFKLVKM